MGKEKGSAFEKSSGDHIQAIVRAGLGAIPVAGQASIEIFSSIVTPPLEKRRLEWMKNIGERLQQLEKERKLDISALSTNDEFITTMMHASQIAMRNHAKEKLEALKNAVINSALPNPPDESRQLLFLHYVDTFTIWHIRIFHLFHDSNGWFQKNGRKAPEFSISSSYSDVLLAAYPELSAHRDLYDIIDSDLNDKGLFSSRGMNAMMSASGAFQKRTSELGDQFLLFISKQ